MREIIILLITLNSFSQEVEPTPVYIYQYTEGVKQLIPVQVIEDNKVYEIKDGIQELLPKYEIERQKNNFEESWQKEF